MVGGATLPNPGHRFRIDLTFFVWLGGGANAESRLMFYDCFDIFVVGVVVECGFFVPGKKKFSIARCFLPHIKAFLCNHQSGKHTHVFRLTFTKSLKTTANKNVHITYGMDHFLT